MIVVKVGGSLFDHPALGPCLRAFVESLAPAEVLLVPGGGPVADAVRELDRVHGLGEEAAHWLALRSLAVTAGLLERIVAGSVGAGFSSSPSVPRAAQRGPTPPDKGAAEKPAPSGISAEVSRACPPLPCQEGGSGGTRGGFPPSSGRGDGGVGPRCAGRGATEKTSPTSASRGAEKQSSSPRILDPFTFALEDEARPGALPHAWRVTTDSIAARAALVFRAERLVLLKSVDVPPDTPWARAAANGWVDAHFPQIAAELTCPIEAVNFRDTLESKSDTRA